MSCENKNKNMTQMIGGASSMMVGTMISRVLGLLREMSIAAFFGATWQLDAFFVAYTLANMTRQLLAEGALSASFVPVFARLLQHDGKVKAAKLAKQALTVILLASGTVTLLGILGAPLFVKFIAPGFSGETRSVAITMTRYMFPFIMLISIAALAMGVLNSVNSFFIPAIAPALSNLTFILFLYFTRHHLTIYHLAAAVLLGGFSHMSLQLIYSARKGITFVPAVPRRDNEELKTMMTLFLPYAAGLSLNQLNPIIDRILGSFLHPGSISVLNYADRVLQLPLGIFVIAISQAVLPLLSKLDPSDKEGFRDFVRDSLRFDLFIILPVAVCFILLSFPIVQILFFRGAFTLENAVATAGALSIYAIGLPAMSCVTITMRAIYAIRMPRVAIRSTAITVVTNLVWGIVFSRICGLYGLAISTCMAFTASAIYATFALRKKLGLKLGIFTKKFVLRQILALAVMAGVTIVFAYFLPFNIYTSVASRIVWLCSAGLISAATYMLITLWFKFDEWELLLSILSKDKKSEKMGDTSNEEAK